MKLNDLVGSIIEIPTCKGLAYAQCSHDTESDGHLLRAFDGFYERRPDEAEQVLSQPVVFSVFYPLAAGIKAGSFKIAWKAPVSKPLQKFPIFKSDGARNTATGTCIWWLWDGTKSWKVGDLTERQRKFPTRTLVNDRMLVFMFENEEWRREHHRF